MNNKKEYTLSTKRALGHLVAVVVGTAATVALAYVVLPAMFSVSYTAPEGDIPPTLLDAPKPQEPLALHLPQPEALKAIYMSQCVVGTPSFREDLVRLVEETELNAIIVDIKDYTGKIAFPTNHVLLKDSVSDACGARDMQAFIEHLHEKGIYVIGRITVFQDPHYATLHPDQAVQKTGGGVWKDNKGLAFVDVGARPFWEYIVELSKVSYLMGFDELNFDYVRFPSDGPMSQAVYAWSLDKSKPQALEEFFAYLSEELRDPSWHPGQPGPVLSADLFGMAATNYDDLGIGQVLERALPYFDAIYPMVYPSHYPKNFNGWSDPNAHAYDIIKYAMDGAVARTVASTTRVAGFTHTPIASTSPQLYTKKPYSKAKIMPWLQSFDYPVHYSPAMVKEQIQATYDAGLDSWLFWDAGNKYTSLRKVLAQ